jgi:murein DD-endopeptidase MepM/ murein hydrolase activator NlpD
LTNNSSGSSAPDKQGNRISLRGRKPGIRGRHFRLSFLTVPLSLALLALALYLQFNRGQRNHPVEETASQVQEIIPAAPLAELREITGIFEPNQTITEVLAKQGLSGEMINQIVDCASPVYNLARVKAHQLYGLCFTQDGKFRDFRYTVDEDRYLTVYHDVAQDRLIPVMKNFQFETRVQSVSAVIEDSLFASISKIGEEDQIALDLADIFGSDIDFNTDIQKGDSFSALVEKRYLDGKFIKNGAVLAASVTNQQKVLTGYRFEDENGKPAYYAPDGRALKRSFLKAPLKVFRITSRFSPSRRHPILKVMRPHLGVDYAAPIGTPVQAVAAGTVVGAGMSGGSGRMVRLRHSGGYETMYLHLSKIAVRSGTRVDQGQVIGYVGSSGLSTGPHLDFRIMRHGVAINPQKVIVPPGKPVSPDQFSRFAELRDKLNSELQITNNESRQASMVETRIR